MYYLYIYKHKIEISQSDVLPFFNHLHVLKDWVELFSNVLNLSKEEYYFH